MASPFQTPANERSFSSLIDEAILVTGKPGSLISAVAAANLTVRECQSFGLFARDLIEEDITTDAEPYVWTRPAYFRSIRAVKYPCIGEHVSLALPGRIQKNLCHFFYAADDYYVFKGIGTGQVIKLANYYWRKPLVYYGRLGTSTVQYPGGPYASRPAYFDISTDLWMYLNAAGDAYVTTLSDPTEEALRRANATNWLVDDWRDLILSGTKAKLWNSGSDPRGVVEFSAYKQNQTLLRNTVGYEGQGF